MTTFAEASPNIYFVGDTGVGKSTLIQTYKHQECSKSNLVDRKVADLRRTVEVRGRTFTMNIKDTFTNNKTVEQVVEKISYPDTVVLCYSVSARQSFENVNEWHLTLRKSFPDVPMLLVGLKLDTKEDNSVTEKEAEKVAAELGLNGTFQISSFNGAEDTFASVNNIFGKAFNVAYFHIAKDAPSGGCCTIG